MIYAKIQCPALFFCLLCPPFLLGQAADFSVRLTAPATAARGSAFNYVATVSGSGTDVTVTDVLPPGVSFVAAGSSPGCVANVGLIDPSTTVTCPVSGSSVTIQVIPVVTGTIRNVVGVMGDQYDPNMSNNWDSKSTVVIGGALVRADFNGDAKNDIVWQNRLNAQASVWYMDGTTVAGVASLPTAIDPNWRFVGTADFNGDGKTDLLLRNQSTGENIIWLMSDTTRITGATLPSQPDLNWVIAGTGDFNGDGQPDIVWQNQVTGQASVWFMSGTTVSGVASLPTASDANYWFVGTGDFNGDGQTDIVLRHQVTGANIVWYMRGTNYDHGDYLPTQSDLTWKIVATADFDGDGKPDLVWRNDSNGQNVFWIVVGTTVTSVIPFNTQPDTTWEIRGPR